MTEDRIVWKSVAINLSWGRRYLMDGTTIDQSICRQGLRLVYPWAAKPVCKSCKSSEVVSVTHRGCCRWMDVVEGGHVFPSSDQNIQKVNV
jgi:hypothetical protein